MTEEEVLRIRREMGSLLWSLRDDSGLRRSEAAARIGMSVTRLKKIEHGQATAKFQKIVALASVYGASTRATARLLVLDLWQRAARVAPDAQPAFLRTASSPGAMASSCAAVAVLLAGSVCLLGDHLGGHAGPSMTEACFAGCRSMSRRRRGTAFPCRLRWRSHADPASRVRPRSRCLCRMNTVQLPFEGLLPRELPTVRSAGGVETATGPRRGVERATNPRCTPQTTNRLTAVSAGARRLFD